MISERGQSLPLPSFPSLLLPLPLSSLPLEVGPLNSAKWSGELCKLPGGAPTEIEFDAF